MKRSTRHAPAGPALAVLLLLLSSAACWAAPPAKLQAKGNALVITQGTQTATLSLAEGGRLRLRVLAKGAHPAALPRSIELAAEPATPVKSGSSWKLGDWTLSPGKTDIAVSKGGSLLHRISLEGTTDAEARVTWQTERAIHGMGQSSKHLDSSGQSFTIYNKPQYGDQTYLYVPFFFTDDGEAFYMNAAGGDSISFPGADTALLCSDTGALDYYLWTSPDPAAIVSDFYRLSGSRSLLPRWAYGYLQSKYGYRNEEEVKSLVTRFKSDGIPLNGVVLDLYWFKHMGDLSWDSSAFPDPAEMDSWLEDRGVKLLAISEPYFTVDSRLYADLAASGGFATGSSGKPIVWKGWWAFDSSGGSIIYPGSEGAKKVLGQAYRDMAASGIDGFWIDLGEPESAPSSALFGPYSEKAYHQTLNYDWAKIVSEAAGSAGKRPFILSRSGTTGIAGLGVATWSGDVSCTWTSLRDQVPLALNAGLSGLPWWGSDVGGFIRADTVAPDPELYLRWQQFGAFMAVDRAHGNSPREPWAYGEDTEQRVIPWIDLREKLVPYTYSTAAEVWDEGLPVMRPLFLAEPGKEALQDRGDEYLFGDAFLVAPVTQPLASSSTKSVYLPAGAWYDISTWERLEGGVETTRQLSLDAIPAFVKEGSVVATDEGGVPTLLAFPGKDSSRTVIFSDDGQSLAYRSGTGERLQVTLDPKGMSFSGALSERDIEVKVWKAPAAAGQRAPLNADAGSFTSRRFHLTAGESRLDF